MVTDELLIKQGTSLFNRHWMPKEKWVVPFLHLLAIL